MECSDQTQSMPQLSQGHLGTNNACCLASNTHIQYVIGVFFLNKRFCHCEKLGLCASLSAGIRNINYRDGFGPLSTSVVRVINHILDWGHLPRTVTWGHYPQTCGSELLHTTEALGCYPEMRLRITGDAWDHHAENKLLEEFSGSTSACAAKRMVDVLGKDLASELRV